MQDSFMAEVWGLGQSVLQSASYKQSSENTTLWRYQQACHTLYSFRSKILREMCGEQMNTQQLGLKWKKKKEKHRNGKNWRRSHIICIVHFLSSFLLSLLQSQRLGPVRALEKQEPLYSLAPWPRAAAHGCVLV